MSIYEKALNEVFNSLVKVKEVLEEVYEYNVINNISKRIKAPNSIINKLKRKHYEVTFENMIENINDIAGIRITCPIKNDIYTLIEIIRNMSDIKVIETKDYISKPKKSGYSGYHMIIEVPIEFKEQIVNIKVEIQLRTMAMDFWATNEHKMRYKSNKKLSKIDSHRLTTYAKIINMLDDKIMEIYNKQELA